MTNLSIEDVIEPLEAYAPGTPRAQLRRVFVDAARRFCQATTAWRDEVIITAGATPAVYTLTAPPGAEAFQATDVWYGTRRLVQSTLAQFRDRYRTGTSPAAFHVKAANSLHIAPEPAASIHTELAVIAALRPAREALEVDSFVLDAYADALFDGAVWRLLLLDGPMRSPSVAEYHRKLFQDSIDYHRGLAGDSGQVGVPRATGYGGY